MFKMFKKGDLVEYIYTVFDGSSPDKRPAQVGEVQAISGDLGNALVDWGTSVQWVCKDNLRLVGVLHEDLEEVVLDAIIEAAHV